MKVIYDINEITIIGEEIGHLETIEVKYMARFDGCVIKFVSDDGNKLVISAGE